MPTTGNADPGTVGEPHDDDETTLDESTVRALVEAAPDGILLVDETNRVAFANHQAHALFGYEHDDLLGRSVDELLPERLRAVHGTHVDRYRAEPRRRSMGTGLLLHGRRADGSEVPVEISLSPLPGDGGLRVVVVVRDVTERLEVEARLQRAEQHLRISEDRDRIARDLHDVVIQKLFAAGMTVQSVAARSNDAEQSGRLQQVVDDLDDTIREIRSVIFSLQSDARDQSGLRADVLRVVDEERAALGCEPRIRFDGPVDATSQTVAAELVPALREALSNVARHARASSVEVDVAHRAGAVTLRVVVDGIGLSARSTGGNGLRNLADRAAKLGGRCLVSAGAEGGTVLEWQVPDPA
jgi:PAS domain S-box-containing protein